MWTHLPCKHLKEDGYLDELAITDWHLMAILTILNNLSDPHWTLEGGSDSSHFLFALMSFFTF